MRVGTTKDQGLYNKPSAAVHPGALAAGTLLQYNTRLQICTVWRSTETLYQGFLYFQNVTHVYGTYRCNFIYSHSKSTAFQTAFFTKLRNVQRHFAYIC